MYEVYLDKILFPVAPEKITYKTKSRSSVVELINMEEINRIKTGGLTEYSFDVLLPGGKVPYAKYLTTYKEPYVYIMELEEIMKNAKPVMFRFVRKDMPYNRLEFSIKKMVVLEGFSVTEAADEGFDVWVGISLREYKKAESTKKEEAKAFGVYENTRESKETAKSYVVQKGDSLWKICKQQLNDGSRAREIAALNGITNPDLIYPGQVIRLEQS